MVYYKAHKNGALYGTMAPSTDVLHDHASYKASCLSPWTNIQTSADDQINNTHQPFQENDCFDVFLVVYADLPSTHPFICIHVIEADPSWFFPQDRPLK